MSAARPAVLVVGAGDATGGAIARRFAREGHVACVARRRAERLWPATAAPDRPALCAGPALTEELATPPWLRRVAGDRAAFDAALSGDQV